MRARNAGGRLPRWARAVPVLASCVACDALLGLEHGSPLDDPCPCAGSRAFGGEGGEGSNQQPSAGGSVAGLEAGGESGHAATGGDGTPATGGRGHSGRAGSTGSSLGGSGAGKSATTGGTPSEDAGAAGECSMDRDCELADPAHCRAACTDGACITRARDTDGDEHGDERCLAAPGDDCDDARSAVEPGAPEACDGVDNDCSGTRDLEDGLPLSGTNETLWPDNGLEPSVAYSPLAQRFGIAWREVPDDPVPGRAAARRLHYRFTDATGAVTGAGSMDFELVTDVAIASANGEFALSWATLEGAFFQRMLPDGAPVGDTVHVTTSEADYVAIAHTTQGGWTAFWHEPAGVYVRKIGTSGELGPSRYVADADTAEIHAVVSGQNILFLGQQAGADVARVVPSSLAGGSIVSFGDPTRNTVQGQMAARPDGFGVVSLDGGNVVFKSLDSAGLTRCGPVVLSEKPFFFTVAPSSSGYVVIGGAALIELTLDCAVLQRTSSFGSEIPGEPRVTSGGDAGFLMVWRISNVPETPTDLGWRRFGARFCD